ncbi:DUF6115 domain-containing protein [Paenibacillus sp. IHBB 10380]|uniref:DUF6115 domain-containing protein n=1 Tax=Paenibacillus sp. IHBB 10380 TaxID=1566358 RepID=UPI0005D826B6|nr:hypothetical protein [Paenibacillus sp. IHBB 10380]AJS59141.1 hypothetical protein UB51_12480 [Paenibacillus sp. IHBB 10380]
MEPWIIIVLLGAAALVYAFMLPKRAVPVDKSSSDRVVKEVEATLEQYMADIEEENNALVELVSQMKKDSSVKQSVLEGQLTELKQQLVHVEQHLIEHANRITITENKQSNDLQIGANIVAEVQPIELLDTPEERIDTIKHRYPELFELHDQGKSIDVIAKTVGLQRGEIQLILQLAKQEAAM